MEVTLFHGGKDIDKTYRYGYQPSGGKDRYEHGAGLYLTADESVAQSYAKGSRVVFACTVDLDPSKEINKIILDEAGLDQCLHTLYCAGLGKASVKKMREYFLEECPNGVPLSWVVNHLVNNDMAKRFAKAINTLVVDAGCTHEITTFRSAQLVIVYDFQIIKSIKKVEKLKK